MRCAMRATWARGFMSLSLTRRFRITDITSTPHAQPSRPPLLHRHSLLRDLSRSQEPYPILLPEGPPERHWPVMPHKPVPPFPPKYPTTPLRSLQIIDKPTYLHGCFHPPQQRDDLLVLQMMCEQRAHDDIDRLLRSILQSIAGHPIDSGSFGVDSAAARAA